MSRLAKLVLVLPALLPAWGEAIRLRPPLWSDADNKSVPRPSKQRVSEVNAILYNSWLRHLSPHYKALSARRPGSLNVNAWDEVPDSSWFTNRIGRQPLSFKELLGSLDATPPEPPPWTVVRVGDEGYTPKLHIRDAAGRKYVFKFDPSGPERNSGAERIATLVMHAAGYNVPGNTVAWFRSGDLRLDDQSVYSDAVGKERRMTAADLKSIMARLKPSKDGRYRGLASAYLPGADLGKFTYTGTRRDDPNDLIPHELRRELRGLYVIASWINHADAGDKNTFDAYIGEDGKGFIRHYLIDFGSALGSGDYINGPYRIGHEYIFDGAAGGRSLVAFGFWRRPWGVAGRILYPEVGYFQSELFEPHRWKPNYPNLAFESMDEADAYWGAKIITAFSDELIGQLAEAGRYSRAEVTAYIRDTLEGRRNAIGRYWLDRITPLEGFLLEDRTLRFRDLAVERGYVSEELRSYRLWAEGGQPNVFRGESTRLPEMNLESKAVPDRYGRTPLARLWIQSARRGGGWALPVELVLGRNRGQTRLEVLGWRHAAR